MGAIGARFAKSWVMVSTPQRRYLRRALACLRAAGLALALSACSLAGALAQNPFSLPDAAKPPIDSAIERAASASDPVARTERMLEIARAYERAEEFGALVHVLERVFIVYRDANTKEQQVHRFGEFVNKLDLSGTTILQRNHLRMMIARYNAFSGYINVAEEELLAILALPDGQLSRFTRADASYMAAYCGYYTNQLERAARYTIDAAEHYVALGESRSAMAAFDGASATYFKLGQVDSALVYSRRAIALAPEIHNSSTANVALNYAEALMAAGLIDSAFIYATAANTFATAGDHIGSIARSEYALGNLNVVSGRYARAIKHYERAVPAFQQNQEFYHVAEVLDSVGRAQARLGAFEPAYRAASQAFRLRDSLREDRIRRDNDIKVAQFERDQMAKELAASEDERELARVILAKRNTERLALLGGAVIALLIFGFVVYRARLRSQLASQLQLEVDSQTQELRDRGAVLEEQARRLQESNAELERFAYIASHDLKTPLRNITSFLGLIERRLAPEPQVAVKEYLQIAIANARHMNDLITDVLEFSRLNTDLLEVSAETSVAATVEQVRQSLRAELEERGAQLRVHGDARLVLPKGTLGQLIGNLVNNGLKYNKSEVPTVDVVTVDMGDRVRISVADNGIGIADEYHDRIFEVFRRLHTADEFAGTGVGLAACRKIALRLGGDIRVESALGFGSTFTIDLPQRCAVKAAVPSASSTADPALA